MDRPMRWNLLLAVAVAVLAVCVRVPPLRQLPVSQWRSTENERVGRALARGQGWADAFGPGTGPTAHLAPLYPLLLSGLYRLVGTSETAAGRWTQCGLSIALATLALLLLPALARKLGLSVAAGWAAALAGAGLPPSAWPEITGSHEQVAATLALLGLLWVFTGVQRRGWSGRGTLLRAGLLVGLTGLLAPNLLLLPVLFFLVEWLRGSGRRGRIVRGGLILATIGLVCVAPWLVRNSLVMGGFVPIRSNFGLELAVGNRPEADGFTYAAGFHLMHPFASLDEQARLLQVGELAYMREKQGQALQWIADHPGRFAVLTLRRAWLFWTGPRRRWFPLTQGESVSGLLALAAVVELVRLLRQGRPAGRLLACALLAVALPYFVTHVEMRYRLPVAGLFALLGCNLAVAVAVKAARRWGRGEGTGDRGQEAGDADRLRRAA
jgi:hypothetical protein